MSTRLDRLTLLLDTGSTDAVREAAAKQIADILLIHPKELQNLIDRVYPFLKSENWATRIAAGKAISSIVQNVKPFDANSDEARAIDDFNCYKDLDEKSKLSSLDIVDIIASGKKLLSSTGKEYETPGVLANCEANKKSISRKFGLGAEYIDNDIFNDTTDNEDMFNTQYEQSDCIVKSESENEHLSARQRNALKRKAKLLAKQSQNMQKQETEVLKKRKHFEGDKWKEISDLSTKIVNGDLGAKESIKLKNENIENREPLDLNNENMWMFESLSNGLITNLYDSSWWVRHGSAIGLRELIKFHGDTAGKVKGYSKEVNNKRNKIWLEDIASRVLTIFALDRFGDYVSDQVVAPIRESATQVLGALLIHLDVDSVKQIYSILRHLLFQNHEVFGGQNIWQVTHGAMLGLKFLIAVRRDFILESNSNVLEDVLVCTKKSLVHFDDDVRAVAAQSLLPIINDLVQKRLDSIMDLIFSIWLSIEDSRDDLTASISSIMDLMANILSRDEVLQRLEVEAKSDYKHSFEHLVPTLFPFLRHSIHSVRQSLLNMFFILSKIKSKDQLKWISVTLLRLCFQNILLERDKSLRELSYDLWIVLLKKAPDDCQEKMKVISLTLWNTCSQAIDTSPLSFHFDKRLLLKYKDDKSISVKYSTQCLENIDTAMINGDSDLIDFECILNSRIRAAEAIGFLLAYCRDSTVIIDICQDEKKINSVTELLLLGFLVIKYINIWPGSNIRKEISRQLIRRLLKLEDMDYIEMLPYLKTIRAQCISLLNSLYDQNQRIPDKFAKLPVKVKGEACDGPYFDLAFAEEIVRNIYEEAGSEIHDTDGSRLCDSLKNTVSDSIASYETKLDAVKVAVSSSLSAALIYLGEESKHTSLFVQSLMESIKKEESLILQTSSASSVAYLIKFLLDKNKSKLLEKVLSNLCCFACTDPANTLDFHSHQMYKNSIPQLKVAGETIDELKIRKIKTRGAILCLEQIFEKFGQEVFIKLPSLQEIIFSPIETAFPIKDNDIEKGLWDKSVELPDSDFGQKVINNLFLFEKACGWMDQNLSNAFFSQITNIFRALQCNYWVIRNAASRCFAAITYHVPKNSMHKVVTELIPKLSDSANTINRMGAIEAILYIVEVMDLKILPYLVFFIVPILGRMSDSEEDIRRIATKAFAILIKLLPLEAGSKLPKDFPEDLIQERKKEREFMNHMMNPSSIQPFEIPVEIKADLRTYQKEGVSWLRFLNTYKLHGILCDDMGLGKTLQTICIVASDHFEIAQKCKESNKLENISVPSIVLCPPTLVGHWELEFKKFVPFLRILPYIGSSEERSKLRKQFDELDVIVTSYENCRNDIAKLKDRNFNYCILDEGHVIKNPRSKMTEAVKQLKSSHRLILSGTPIQNNLLELWSLFDFLMPGYLGSEQSFNQKYSKPVNASRDSKSTSKEIEAASTALDSLHKQVLPFLLRRLKSDVLLDLPPKIIQDYYCDLSPLQAILYQSFERAQAANDENSMVIHSQKKKDVLESLHYVRKLCNHPALVLNEEHPLFKELIKDYNLRDISNAPKLLALKELLFNCGIGIQQADVANQHRVLIFFQQIEMLDLVENDLLKKELPTVSYLKLDGRIEPKNRFQIVNKFNSDVSIDVLLLTTHVGGLGLNLTGADTVIFVEHDWNPMKDFQAMDRAHRVGQKRVVNVYRFITRKTIEEKIMGLQNFKMSIAATIIDEQNRGLETMNTHQILDMLNGGQIPNKKDEKSNSTDAVALVGEYVGKYMKKALGDIKELWDESEYDDFKLDGFMKSLTKVINAKDD